MISCEDFVFKTNHRDRSKTKRKKLMLWIPEDLVMRVDLIKPPGITTQEAIRQIVSDWLVEEDPLPMKYDGLENEFADL